MSTALIIVAAVLLIVIGRLGWGAVLVSRDYNSDEIAQGSDQ